MVIFVFEAFNKDFNMFSPNNWPPSLEMHGPKLPEYITKRFARGLPRYFEDKITLKLHEELNESEKYFYPIIIEKLDYIKYMDANNFSFDFINEKIIDDVRKNKAKIIFLLWCEGHITVVNDDCVVDDFLIIDRWCKKFNFTKNQVYFLSGNMLGPELCRDFDFTALISNEVINWNPPNYINDDLIFLPKSEKCLFLSYNRIAKNHRTVLLCELIKNDLLDNGLVSYKGNSHRSNAQHVAINFHRNDLLKEAEKLDQIKPIVLDIEDLEKNNPIYIDSLEHYEQTFVSILTETLYVNSSIFITEKTWKTISVGHPFFVVSSKDFLKKLRGLGFKTFDKWFDESYDDLEDINDRIKLIISELKRLNNLGLDQLIKIRQEMSETLRYNKLLHAEYFKKSFDLDNNFSILGQINSINF